jgi:hypothetical protein
VLTGLAQIGGGAVFLGIGDFFLLSLWALHKVGHTHIGIVCLGPWAAVWLVSGCQGLNADRG